MIAAAGADEFIHAGVAAFETAVHDADGLVPKERRAAVARLTSERGCHDILQLSAQPRVTAIMRAWHRDYDRTGSQPGMVSIARTAHSTTANSFIPSPTSGPAQEPTFSSMPAGCRCWVQTM
jgi:hypothetical protein